MDPLIIQCPAKINLTLDIVGRREDGYHLMEMVMQTISLYDILCIVRTDMKNLEFESDSENIPSDETNLVLRSAKAFLTHMGLSAVGLKFYLKKRIPSGAGLGGGSADAAGVLLGLNTLFECNLSLSKLMQIGVSVGADVPFCLHGGTALVKGIGEQVIPVAPLKDCHIVIAKPDVSSSTVEAFHEFDQRAVSCHPNTAYMLASLQASDLVSVSKEMCNVFEKTVLLTDIIKIKKQMLSFGALSAIMTGSGSAVFSIFTDSRQAAFCCDHLKSSGVMAFQCRPCRTGAFIT